MGLSKYKSSSTSLSCIFSIWATPNGALAIASGRLSRVALDASGGATVVAVSRA